MIYEKNKIVDIFISVYSFFQKNIQSKKHIIPSIPSKLVKNKKKLCKVLA